MQQGIQLDKIFKKRNPKRAAQKVVIMNSPLPNREALKSLKALVTSPHGNIIIKIFSFRV